MKKLTFLLLMSFLITSYMSAQVASDYYPMHVGDYWIWDNDPIGNSDWGPRTIRWEIVGTDSILGEEYLIQERREIAKDGSFDNVFAVFWLREDSLGNILIIAFGSTTELDSAIVLDVPGLFFPNEFLILGYTFEYEYEGVLNKVSIESISETVEVPVGTFTDCIKFRQSTIDSLDNVLKLKFEYYAQGIGMVLAERTLPDSQANRSELVEYSIQQVSVDDNNGANIPSYFRLHQNYPNPFNPVTTISYQLSKSEFVNLSIYNVTGQLVETIVNERINAGYHSISWNASGVGSGVYFYRISTGFSGEAGEYTETKKCLILK